MENQPPNLPMDVVHHVKPDLTFGDGFRFGCGFMAAIIVFWIVLGILSSLLAGLAFLIAPQLSNLLPHLMLIGP
jgi:hypothetical protein